MDFQKLPAGGYAQFSIEIFVMEFQCVFLDIKLGHNFFGCFSGNIEIIDQMRAEIDELLKKEAEDDD